MSPLDLTEADWDTLSGLIMNKHPGFFIHRKEVSWSELEYPLTKGMIEDALGLEYLEIPLRIEHGVDPASIGGIFQAVLRLRLLRGV